MGVVYTAYDPELDRRVALKLLRPKGRNSELAATRLLREAQATPEIQEYHIVAGDYDYLLKLRCRDSRELERLLRETVRSIAGVARTNSTIVMLTPKETCAVPLPEPDSE